MPLWRIPCSACGGTFVVFSGEQLPDANDVVAVANLRHINGAVVLRQDIVQCDTCGANVKRMSARPDSWRPEIP
jgi:hypothetical protein